MLVNDPFRQWWLGFHYTEAVTGSIKLGGVATESYVPASGSSTYNESMSGGTKADGDTTELFTYNVVMSGGTKANGDTTELLHYNASVSGGTKANGDTTELFNYNASVSGGTKANGDTTELLTYNASVSGGTKISGAAVASLIRTAVVSGGTKLSSTAVASLIHTAVVSGGTKLSGACVNVGTYALNVSGGTKLSGAAYVLGSVTYNESMTGGAKLSGDATIKSIYTFPVRETPHTCTVTRGTTTDPVTTTWLKDSNFHMVREVTGATGISYMLYFGNVPRLGITRSLRINVRYAGSDGHICYLQLYNYTTSTYDNLIQLPETAGFVDRNFAITDDYFSPFDYYSGANNAVFKVDHPSPGNINHWVGIDELIITSNTGTELSGSANVSVVYACDMSNGAKLNGACDESLNESTNTYNETMSGGVRLSGLTIHTHYVNADMSGGTKLSGTSTLVTQYSQTMYGGSKVSGNAASTSRYTSTALGGAKLSGYVDISESGVINETMSGGLKLDGTARLVRLLYSDVSGGIKSAGEVERLYTLNPMASGGILAVGNSNKINIGRPDEDTNTGLYWTQDPPFWSKLNESVAGTFVHCALPLGYSNTLEVGMSGNTRISPNISVNFMYRMSVQTRMTVVASVVCGSTVIASWTTSGGGLVTYSRKLTEAQIANITDFSDVRVRFVCTSTNISPVSAYIYWARLYVENAGMADVEFTYNPVVSGGAELAGVPYVLGIGAHVMRATTTTGIQFDSLTDIAARLSGRNDIGIGISADTGVEAQWYTQTELDLKETAALHVL
jgi:hypothetical protein